VILEMLLEAVHARKSVLLSGDPGVDTTCLLRALHHALPPQTTTKRAAAAGAPARSTGTRGRAIDLLKSLIEERQG
jgi:Mg-chelatase subunit ChlI